MILNNITELIINGVYSRGIPNQEHIVIYVNAPINMAQYGLVLGVSQPYGLATPIRDNFFWFGEANLKAGDWLFIYTGPGNPRVIPSKDGLNSIYTIYWNREKTILHDTNIIPVLFRMDAVQTPTPPTALSQI